jgi:hypothetical protein
LVDTEPLKQETAMMKDFVGGGLLALLVMADAMAAQEQPPVAPPPAGSLEAPPERIEPEVPIGEPAPGESLSDRLEESRGVIKPPRNIDPGLVEEPPDPQRFPTPVIPPGATTPETAPR